MKHGAIIACTLGTILAILSACFASGYRGDIAQSWDESSIVVLGQPKLLSPTGYNSDSAGRYSLNVCKVYKGNLKLNATIDILDPYPHSTASVGIESPGTYLIFLQTQQDRNVRPQSVNKNLKHLTTLRAFKTDSSNLKEIESAVNIVKEYKKLPQKERKAFLLKHLSDKNEYYHSMIVREILIARITEAIPYFKKQLMDAQSEDEKLRILANLRCLGDPDIKKILCDCLADDSFKKKAEIIEEMAKSHDKSLMPVIRQYVNDQDEYIAVTARCAILRLGDPSAKKLLLDMIQNSKNPTARYNAIHTLNWNYSGKFTPEEKAVIRGLVNDKDPFVARVAGFITKKWKPTDARQSSLKISYDFAGLTTITITGNHLDCSYHTDRKDLKVYPQSLEAFDTHISKIALTQDEMTKLTQWAKQAIKTPQAKEKTQDQDGPRYQTSLSVILDGKIYNPNHESIPALRTIVKKILNDRKANAF